MQNDELESSHHALELERLKFVGLFNAAPIGYLILSTNGQISEINEIGKKMLLAGAEIVVGKNFSSFIAPYDRNEFYTFINRVQKLHLKANCEIRIHPKGAPVFFAQLDGSIVTDPGSGNENFYITITDITKLKSSEQKLWESTERLSQTLEASHTGTWRVELNDGTVFLDHYSKQILDLNENESQPTLKELYDLVMESDRKKLITLVNKLCNTQEVDIELGLQTSVTSKIILIKGKAIDQLDGSTLFTGIISDISERKQLLEKEEEHERNQQSLLRRAAIDAQEKERHKISASLHDSVCQILYGIRFKLNHLQKNEPTETSFSNINELLDLAIKELRTISGELSPSILKDFGFTSGMKDMIHHLENAGFKVNSKIDRQADTLPAETQLYIFRIIQELLNNSIKHSGASQANVTVRFDKTQILIIVKDEGNGFQIDIDQALKEGSGLRAIKNRVSLLNGNLEISNDQGATFTISFPKEQ
nr:ATP-binding protein [Pedobacter petrophilus]